MALVNALTGETDVGGIRILLTVDAWLMIEQLTGKSALHLLHETMAMEIGFSEVRAILIGGAEGYRRRHNAQAAPLNEARITKAIEDVGLLGILADLAAAVKGSKALGLRDEEVAADEAAPFGGTGDDSSSAPLA